jgi:hypothetical protein
LGVVENNSFSALQEITGVFLRLSYPLGNEDLVTSENERQREEHERVTPATLPQSLEHRKYIAVW